MNISIQHFPDYVSESLMQSPQHTETLNIFWFRRDLRLEDNHGLFRALESGKSVLPLFIFDSNILESLSNRADARVTFIYDQLVDIHRRLREVGSGLFVVHGPPEQVFTHLLRTYTLGAVFVNHDYEPYALQRDEAVRTVLAKSGVDFNTFKDQVIFERDEVSKADGSPYTVFTPYSKAWKKRFAESGSQSFASELLLSRCVRKEFDALPTLADLGFHRSEISVEPIVVAENVIQQYHTTRDIPSLKGTSRLSVHLRFGTVSIRLLVQRAKELNETWLNELIWREFFMMILWSFPHVVGRSFREAYEAITWRNNLDEFESWCRGTTGYALVDAGMRELNTTGFMHNRVRMLVASFLCKHLLIDWRWGEAYFAEKLLDFELSSNNGNWQWAAGCGCDAAPYFRIFSPLEQQRKFDPDMIYIRRWLTHDEIHNAMPIVEHAVARERALLTYKNALS